MQNRINKAVNHLLIREISAIIGSYIHGSIAWTINDLVCPRGITTDDLYFYVVDGDSGIKIYDKQSGRFAYQLLSKATSCIAVIGEHLYVAQDGSVKMLNKTNGKIMQTDPYLSAFCLQTDGEFIFN